MFVPSEYYKIQNNVKKLLKNHEIFLHGQGNILHTYYLQCTITDPHTDTLCALHNPQNAILVVGKQCM